LLRAVLDRFEYARVSSGEKFTVSGVSSRLGKGKGRGCSEGLRVHSRIFGDIDWVLEYRDICIPLPLAWLFRFGWVLGVADLVCFRSLKPYRVVEVKSYNDLRASEFVQASIYGLLASLNFGVKPEVFVKAPSKMIPVNDWEEKAIGALESHCKSLPRCSGGL
jgi:hypothetical protein